MSTAIDRFVDEARSGTNPHVIARMPSGWAVLGSRQVLPGYSLLLPDPVVPDLNALRGDARTAFLDDMVTLGDALLAVTGAARINYEILGNLEPALHAHVVPRFADEPEANRHKPVWSYDWNARPAFDAERDAPLMAAIREHLGMPAP